MFPCFAVYYACCNSCYCYHDLLAVAPFSALTLLVGRQEGHPACKKLEWWSIGVVFCLERDADLHTAQLMPLPLAVSCFSNIQIGFTFLLPAHPGSPGKRAVKRVCVCVCVCIGVGRRLRVQLPASPRRPAVRVGPLRRRTSGSVAVRGPCGRGQWVDDAGSRSRPAERRRSFPGNVQRTHQRRPGHARYVRCIAD